MNKDLNILLVEDNPGDVRIINELLKEQTLVTFNITYSISLKETIEKLSESSFDIVLLDLGLPDSVGFETFAKINARFPLVNAIIILTGLNDSEIGLKAVYQGAQDYMIKGQIDSERLLKSIFYSIERSRLNLELKTQLDARKAAEDNAIRLNRLLLILSNVNQAIVRIDNKTKLVDDVCTNLIRIGQFLQVVATFNYPDEKYSKCFTEEGAIPCNTEVIGPD